MAGQTLALFDAVLKEDYLGPIRDQINNATVLLKRLERNEEDVVGTKAVVPLHTARNSGVGARADGAALPTAGYQEYTEANYNCKYNYGRIQVTGPTIAASSKDRGAFVKVVDAEIQGMVKDLKDDLNRQLHGNGTGTLCLLSADPGTGAVTYVDVDTPGTQYIQKGMAFDICDPTGATAGANRGTASTGIVVTQKTSSTRITFASNTFDAAVADNDAVVRKGSWLNEMMGLNGIVNNADPVTSVLYVGGIVRATAGNEFWDAYVSSNSGTNRALTLELMQTVWDGVEEEGGEISMMMTSRAVRRKYVTLVKADGRTVNNMDIDGGFDAVEYNGKPLFVDKHCLPNKIYFLDESTLAIYRMSDLDWMDKDGAILSRVTGYDAYEAVLYMYATLGCSACNRNGVLADISA